MSRELDMVTLRLDGVHHGQSGGVGHGQRGRRVERGMGQIAEIL